MSRILMLLLVLSACVGLALADTLPLHGYTVHLDPYFTPGAVALGPPFGELVAPFSVGVPHVGGDGLAAVDGWHWQDEFDILGFAGPAALFHNGVPLGIVLFGPGTDFIIDFHQPDSAGAVPGLAVLPFFGLAPTCLGGGMEMGPVCKQMWNLTPFVVAHGVAVEERKDGDPIAPPPMIPPPVFEVFGKGANATMIRFGSTGTTPAFFISDVPEPGVFGLVAAGLACALLARRRAVH
jgi:hypothetical protein